MDIQQTSSVTWWVKGKYSVTFSQGSEGWRCTCPHFLYRRPPTCKHIDAVLEQCSVDRFNRPLWHDAIYMADDNDHWHKRRLCLMRRFTFDYIGDRIVFYDGLLGFISKEAAQVAYRDLGVAPNQAAITDAYQRAIDRGDPGKAEIRKEWERIDHETACI